MRTVILWVVGLAGLFSLWAFQAKPAMAIDTPTLEIELPPTNLIKLQSFKFGGYVCDMSADTFNPATCSNNGNNWQFSRDTITDDDTSSNLDDRYRVRVTGFAKGDGLSLNSSQKFLASMWQKLQSLSTAKAYAPPPATFLCSVFPTACGGTGASPYGYQVTFSGGTGGVISSATISNYTQYLANNPQSNAYLGTDRCVLTGSGPTRLCLKSQIKLMVPENENVPPVFVAESIALPGGGTIQFENNVGGSGTLSGFGFVTTNPKAVAVGGTVSGNINKITNYVTQSTKLGWTTIAPQLNNMFAKRAQGTEFTPTNFGGSSWNLNSSSSDPAGHANSFSSPPEGKLWNVNHGLVFDNNVTFIGRGTIAVNGNVEFRGNVSCLNSQLGIIASGSITFRGDVGCGVYTALNGNVTFSKSIGGNTTWKGIFVAQNDVDLPTVSAGTLTIQYDTAFANDPTVLFKELLGIIFGTNS